jgi:hypothetical protein
VGEPGKVESVITRLPTGDDRDLELWKCNRYYDRLDDTDEASPWELHNLTVDPEERVNRAADTDAATVFGQLRTVLEKTRASMRRTPQHVNSRA